MKKLKLNFQNFSNVESLSRSHMRKVLGGNSLMVGDESTGKVCDDNSQCPKGTTCQKVSYDTKFMHCE